MFEGCQGMNQRLRNNCDAGPLEIFRNAVVNSNPGRPYISNSSSVRQGLSGRCWGHQKNRLKAKKKGGGDQYFSIKSNVEVTLGIPDDRARTVTISQDPTDSTAISDALETPRCTLDLNETDTTNPSGCIVLDKYFRLHRLGSFDVSMDSIQCAMANRVDFSLKGSGPNQYLEAKTGSVVVAESWNGTDIYENKIALGRTGIGAGDTDTEYTLTVPAGIHLFIITDVPNLLTTTPPHCTLTQAESEVISTNLVTTKGSCNVSITVTVKGDFGLAGYLGFNETTYLEESARYERFVYDKGLRPSTFKDDCGVMCGSGNSCGDTKASFPLLLDGHVCSGDPEETFTMVGLTNMSEAQVECAGFARQFIPTKETYYYSHTLELCKLFKTCSALKESTSASAATYWCPDPINCPGAKEPKKCKIKFHDLHYKVAYDNTNTDCSIGKSIYIGQTCDVKCTDGSRVKFGEDPECLENAGGNPVFDHGSVRCNLTAVDTGQCETNYYQKLQPNPHYTQDGGHMILTISPSCVRDAETGRFKLLNNGIDCNQELFDFYMTDCSKMENSPNSKTCATTSNAESLLLHTGTNTSKTWSEKCRGVDITSDVAAQTNCTADDGYMLTKTKDDNFYCITSPQRTCTVEKNEDTGRFEITTCTETCPENYTIKKVVKSEGLIDCRIRSGSREKICNDE